jgi:outer membrane receptor protein involved in Fe transport
MSSKLPSLDITGETYAFEVDWAGMLDVNYRPSAFHKLLVRGLRTQSATDRVFKARGNDDENRKRWQAIDWNERSLSMMQISGEHTFPSLAGMDLSWRGFQSWSEAKEPDRKNLVYTRGSGAWSMGENYRTWAGLSEDSWGGDLNLAFPVAGGSFKIGAHTSVRKRAYDVAAYSSVADNADPALTLLPPDEIFAPENYGGRDGFVFTAFTDLTGQYEGEHRLNAYYAMLDLPFKIYQHRFRLAQGCRVEDSRQTVTGFTADPTELFRDSEVDVTDMLPSANLTYLVSDRANLRLGFYKSVNRPEFREMAYVKYYDFNEFQNVRGNPDLKRASVTNYDVRLEVFPGLGEVFAASYFSKSFDDPIEVELKIEPTRPLKTWFNSPKGKAEGWELEFRKSFETTYSRDAALVPFPFLSIFSVLGMNRGTITLTANYANIHSEVQHFTGVPPNLILRRRPMEGQSPWMTNVSVSFIEPSLGSSLTLLYNKIGRRLDKVQDTSARDDQNGDIWEEPRDVLDLAFTQQLPAHIKFKFTVKNMLASDEVFTMGYDWNKTPYGRVGHSPSYKFGLSLSI